MIHSPEKASVWLVHLVEFVIKILGVCFSEMFGMSFTEAPTGYQTLAEIVSHQQLVWPNGTGRSRKKLDECRFSIQEHSIGGCPYDLKAIFRRIHQLNSKLPPTR